MKIRFSPIRMDCILEASLSEDVLTLNGEDYDFSDVVEAEPIEKHDCPWIIGPVSRVDGELELTLLLPHGGNPPHETVFPEPVQVGSGVIPLPAYEAPIEGDPLE